MKSCLALIFLAGGCHRERARGASADFLEIGTRSDHPLNKEYS